MSHWKGLEIESEGTGISRPLSENVNLLGAMLGEAIRARYGEETLELVEVPGSSWCRRGRSRAVAELRSTSSGSDLLPDERLLHRLILDHDVEGPPPAGRVPLLRAIAEDDGEARGRRRLELRGHLARLER